MPRDPLNQTVRALPELLAPAGSPAAFRCALAAGADAIYCGLSELNARRGADNFTEESFAEACELAHLAGSRVYLTENISVKDAELEDACALAVRAAALGADALIVADLGLMSLLAKRAPELELHVSTQANVGDVAGLRLCAELGASRVTLSRELSLAEIREVCAAGRELGMECEVFCHGALCMAYSGLCRMSAARGARSANRGLCAQPCRLPHRLVAGDGTPLAGEESRALCPKDLCAVDELAELVDAGVAALKIEGRMKAPDYVLAVVGAWREALDAVRVDPAGALELDGDSRHAAREKLSRAFNRSFTSSYLHGRSGNEMMSYERSNNRGALVGEVAKSRGNRVVVELAKRVGEGDLLEFRPEEAPDRFLAAPSPRSAGPGELLEMELKRTMPVGVSVRALREEATIKASRTLGKARSPRLRPVDLSTRIHVGEALRLRLSTPARTPEERAAYGSHVVVEVGGEVVEPARTKPLEERDVVRHLARFGGSPFEARRVEVDLSEGAGLGFSALHHLRAEAAEALGNALLAPVRDRGKRIEAAAEAPLPPLVSREPRATSPMAPEEAEICCLAPSLEVARAARDAGTKRVYLAQSLCDAGTARAEGFIPWLTEISRARDAAEQDRLILPGEPCVVSTFSALERASSRGAAFEAGTDLPIFNAACVEALAQRGATGVWLSFELASLELARIARVSPVPVGLKVAGALRAMTTQHCVLQVAGECAGECERCTVRASAPTLENIDGRFLPVRQGTDGRSRIFWDAPLDLVPRLSEVLAAGVKWLLVDATLMGSGQAADAISRVRGALEAIRMGRALPRVGERATLGHFLEPVG